MDTSARIFVPRLISAINLLLLILLQ